MFTVCVPTRRAARRSSIVRGRPRLVCSFRSVNFIPSRQRLRLVSLCLAAGAGVAGRVVGNATLPVALVAAALAPSALGQFGQRRVGRPGHRRLQRIHQARVVLQAGDRRAVLNRLSIRAYVPRALMWLGHSCCTLMIYFSPFRYKARSETHPKFSVQ